MLVTKKYDITTVPAPDTITADGNVVTGNASAKYRGVNPNFITGATGNAAAAAGGTYIDRDSIVIGTGNVTSKFHSIAIDQTVVAGNNANYFSEPITRLGYNDPREIKGVILTGVENPTPVAGATPTPNLQDITGVIKWHVTDGKLSFIVPAGSQALVQNKKINCLIFSQNIQSV